MRLTVGRLYSLRYRFQRVQRPGGRCAEMPPHETGAHYTTSAYQCCADLDRPYRSSIIGKIYAFMMGIWLAPGGDWMRRRSVRLAVAVLCREYVRSNQRGRQLFSQRFALSFSAAARLPSAGDEVWSLVTRRSFEARGQGGILHRPG